MDAVSSALLEPVTNSVLDLIKKQVDYIRYRRNFDELDECVKQLKHKKEIVDHKCEEAVKNGHEIEGKVREWLGKVGKFETEVEKYRKDDGHKKTRFSNCLFLYFWHRLGRLAKKMAVEGKKITDDCPKSDEIAYRVYVTSNDAILSNNDLMDFGSRKSIMEQIMATLVEDPTVKMIGVYGRSGVGKSTLIKAIAKIARDKKLFNVVAFSEITDNPNLKQVQEDIAYPLGLKLEGEGENVRADNLRRRLKKEKENTLIILDDLWDRLDLNRLGIPLDGDVDDNDLSKKTNSDNQGPQGPTKEKSLGDYKGCKILLTSRKQNVLTDKMEVKLTFCVEELDEKDALKLFRKEAGIHGEMSKSKQEIVKKYCAGLPMAIVTVGRALRDKSDSEWEKLKNQDLVGDQNPMEISVKMSYDHLENEELKSIFFLCAQMGHQPLIMDLVKYCFGLGILEGVYSLGEARGKISTSIQKLKNSGLVLDGSSSIHFNMHDLVRDAALSIAQKEHNAFTLRNGKLDDWPELESSGTEMICFSPFTDCSFTKLKTIKVEKCDQLKNLFSFCMVKLLASLETIGVSNCGSLEEIIKIPDNSDKIEFLKLMSLSLESLSSFTSFYTIEGSSTDRDEIQITVAENEHSEMAPPLFGELVEIPNLENLNLISMNKIQKIWSDQPPSLRKLKGLFVSNCKMEKIFSTEGNSADKVCIFPKLEEIHLDQMIELTDIWQAEYCKGLRNLMASSTAKSLVQLKSMTISGCDELEEIVSNEGNEEAEQIVFGKLITIELVRLKKLKSFCSYKNYEFKFPSLEVLIVRKCPWMQRFTEGGARAAKLQNIVTAYEVGKEEAKWQWEGDLNATIQNVWEDQLSIFSILAHECLKNGHNCSLHIKHPSPINS
ncbi:Putative disease resistance protein [Glycine soja]|uniref:Putative disease resistance protein n=1 Tax=Glycine soja TaxID=3848 RepID=A0A0B2SMA2_GLYSO|nr:Putative disease resistance protein [Glycine soja]